MNISRRRRAMAVAAALILAGGSFAAGRATASAGPSGAVQAAFTARSYAPGSLATLELSGGASSLTVRFYRAGAGHTGVMEGQPVVAERTFARPGTSLRLRLGSWPSGLYYAKVVTPSKGFWYAPFVLRPQHLGTSDVLVVLPTNTWQAYNFEGGDSWYEHSDVTHIDLARPFVDSGVPPHYHNYDRGFIRWLTLHDYEPDFISDDDLERLSSAATLARDYRLIVFSGHEEYATEHSYDLIQSYRNLGGHLAFLSANDFFYKVTKQGNTMTGRWRWRDLGRPEAALVGAQYIGWNEDRYANRPFRITGVRNAPWLFAGTGLHDGSTLGIYGIEIDARTPASPPGTKVLADIPNIFGPGRTAQMTYYSTGKGAEVFSAGVMNFGGSALWPTVNTMLENLWVKLTAT
ncbi:MAG TPA: N,N-dimethylformamidase beta subunit family domain-containing protein [Gaiellaceae bacterium]|nr:N,N-dimethylformamidase beta subunit family domain-containing protein [Gaiellaceae bacterium]